MSHIFDLRPAHPADLPAILALERNAFGAPHWTLEDYASFVDARSGRRCLMVASAGGNLFGFAAASVVAGEGDLESVAVDAAHRRQGLGKALCLAVIDWCRERDAGRLFLEVRASDTGARQLYCGLGFHPVGQRKGYYTDPVDDAVLMCLTLPKTPKV